MPWCREGLWWQPPKGVQEWPRVLAPKEPPIACLGAGIEPTTDCLGAGMAPGGSPPRSPGSPGIAAMRSPGRVSSPGMDRNAAFLQFKAGVGQQLNQVGSADTAHRGVAGPLGCKAAWCLFHGSFVCFVFFGIHGL